MQSEYRANGEEPTFGLHFAQPDFEEVLKAIDDWAKGVNLPPGEGRRRVFWLVRDVDDRLLGTVNIRSLDTEYFVTVGGNIGYSVRPTERRKGYATRMLSVQDCPKRQAGRSAGVSVEIIGPGLPETPTPCKTAKAFRCTFECSDVQVCGRRTGLCR